MVEILEYKDVNIIMGKGWMEEEKIVEIRRIERMLWLKVIIKYKLLMEMGENSDELI